MTLIDILLPSDQSEGTESVIAAWFKAEGDAVAENEPLLEISTDKVTVEIAAPASGVLREILKREGDEVDPGDVVGRIAPGVAASGGADRPLASSPPRPSSSAAAATTAELSPAVRRLLQQHGLDPASIAGTGKGGRITAQDVESHLAPAPAAPAGGAIPGRRVPHSPMRRSVAEHMARSMQTAPHVTSLFEADLSAVAAHRNEHQAAMRERGVRLTYTAYFVRAATKAIAAVPQANARWHADALEIWEDVNLGVATALEQGGLIVPVVRKAQALDLEQTAAAIEDLVTRARNGALTPKDVQQGTFTLSNHGVSGSLLAAPIVINQPQSAILGIGKLQKRAVVVESGGREEVAVRPMVYVTLTIDHRVLDGYDANRFLSRFVEVLEGWG